MPSPAEPVCYHEYMSGTTSFILSAVAAAAMLAWSGATSAQDAGAGQKPAQAQEPSGQQVLEKSCQGCHDLRPIQTSAKDAKAWTETIAAMVDNGAEID